MPSYGAFLVLAFAVGITVAERRAAARGLAGEPVLDVSLVILVTSILGSRLLFVMTHVDHFRPPQGSWSDALNLLGSSAGLGGSGLSMMGGVALAVVASLLFLRLRGLPVLRYVDLLAPSVALGEGITRIGCFLNGCCSGLACSYPWAVTFPHAGGVGVAVHPAQLYASLLGFAIFAALVALARRRPVDGCVFLAFLILIGAQRFALDLVRSYEESSILFRAGGTPWTIHQALSLILIVIGSVGLWALRRHGSSGRAPS